MLDTSALSLHCNCVSVERERLLNYSVLYCTLHCRCFRTDHSNAKHSHTVDTLSQTHCALLTDNDDTQSSHFRVKLINGLND